jgi:hypothetical protein
MTNAFFRNFTIDEKRIHPMWNKFDEIRIKRKQVIHPNIKKINYSDAHKVVSNAIKLHSWILDLARH